MGSIIIEKGKKERSSELPFRLECVEGSRWLFIRESGELVLFEWKNYEINANGANVIIPGLENIRRSNINTGTFTFIFRNYIGNSTLIIEDSHGNRREFSVIVLSEKFGKISHKSWEVIDLSKIHDIIEREEAIERLIKKFNILSHAFTDYITKISSQLNFSIMSPTAFIVKETDEPMNDLFTYHYLRSNKERITEAFETILRRIKRKLVAEKKWLKPNMIDKITPETTLSIIQHPEYIVPAGNDVLIAHYLKGYVPTKVLGYQKYESFDTPENRFVKYFLSLLSEWSEHVIEEFQKDPSADIKSVKELLEELEFIESNSIWSDIGKMKMFPYISQTLLKGEGYRDILELYREFTAYVPFFDELQKAINNKDITKLYEYWAFFRLIEEIGMILNKRKLKIYVTPFGELSDSGNVYAEFDNGWRLYYNKKLTSRKWSYSVTLRPDFSLFNGDPLRDRTELIGVFDAKFKLDVVNEPEAIKKFDEVEKILKKNWKYSTWVKLEDIYKMHTYRDALNCKFAIAVYPGSQSVFFDMRKDKIEKFTISDILLRNIHGVGYLKLVPEVC